MEICGRRFDTGEPVRLEIDGAKVVTSTPCDSNDETALWPWIAPGLIDIQINGYGGQEFSSAELTVEKVRDIVLAYDAFGMTRCCPTVTTQSPRVMADSIRTIAGACEAYHEVAARVAGIHVEGPFLSREDGPRGAHPREHVRRPDWDEFQRMQEAAGGRIVIFTLSPEYDEAPGFIEKVAASGVVVSLGHTAANEDQIKAAVDAGAQLSTHLGNGAHATIPRHHNYIWAQLAEDRLIAELIGDGHHLPPFVLKAFIRAKTPSRCILTSDISGLAGLPPGRYGSELCELEILPNGKLVVAGQREVMAGASAPLGTSIVNAIRYAGVSMAEAIQMAVFNPAALLGIECGGLESDSLADLVLFDITDESDPTLTPFSIRQTILAGEVVYPVA